MSYYVHVRNILGVQTNVDDFIWLYGKQSPIVSEKEFNDCLVKLRICVMDDKDTLSKNEWDACDGKFLPFAVNTKENILCYNRELILGKQLRYRIEIKGNEIIAAVSQSYYKFVKMRIMNIHSIQHVLSDIVTGILLKNGYLSLYCSSVYFPNEKRCALFFSAPGVGKTTTCRDFCENYGGVFVSEDVALTNGESIWSVPWTNSKRKNQKEKRTKLDRRVNDSREMERMMKDGRICHVTRMTDIFVLERGNNAATITSTAAVMPKVFMLNHYLFHYSHSPAVTILDYFLPTFSLDEMKIKDQKIHEKIASQTTQTSIVLPYGEHFTQEILRILQKKENLTL